MCHSVRNPKRGKLSENIQVRCSYNEWKQIKEASLIAKLSVSQWIWTILEKELAK